MALNPEDLGSGFRHSKVSTFINEQMAKHDKGLDFYLENLSLSWEEVEDKLKVILEDSEVSSEAREACAWGTLALGVRFAHRQGCLQGHGVQWLQDLSSMHKVSPLSLPSDLKQLTHQQKTERKELAIQLQMTQAKLEEVQRERDLLRLKILQEKFAIPPSILKRCGGCQHYMQAKISMIIQPFNRVIFSSPPCAQLETDLNRKAMPLLHELRKLENVDLYNIKRLRKIRDAETKSTALHVCTEVTRRLQELSLFRHYFVLLAFRTMRTHQGALRAFDEEVT
ncbi:testis-expressed protein 13B-like [Alexandromys fortis]|uniref:testis-expressed protein 13B-like n=1 Tax=Alexandromys fortis TaxID=100897 RepID=UPI0021526870|nr:testis-expressed protein 13B-like [Microtus fortis]